MTFSYTNVQSINHRVIFFLLMLMSTPALGADSIPVLYSSTGNLSQDGHVKLEWQADSLLPGSTFEVQQAADEEFRDVRSIYQGPDMATFVSGLENGTYYYRVRIKGQDWSNVLGLSVQHHSLSLTFILLGLGAIVFLLTAGIVINGARKSSLAE